MCVCVCVVFTQCTRLQRIVTLFASFVTSLAFVAFFYGQQQAGISTSIAITVAAGFAMMPCRMLLPRLFRASNAYPSLNLWSVPSFASASAKIVLDQRRATAKLRRSSDERAKPALPSSAQPYSAEATAKKELAEDEVVDEMPHSHSHSDSDEGSDSSHADDANATPRKAEFVPTTVRVGGNSQPQRAAKAPAQRQQLPAGRRPHNKATCKKCKGLEPFKASKMPASPTPPGSPSLPKTPKSPEARRGSGPRAGPASLRGDKRGSAAVKPIFFPDSSKQRVR